MPVRRRWVGARAVALGASLLLAPCGASAATGDLPSLGQNVKVGKLAAGGTYIVGPVVGAPAAAVELWYRAPSTGFGDVPVPTLARLSAQVVAASKPLLGPSLGTLVDGLGGRLSITVYNDSVSIAALVPANATRSVVRAMTTAYFAPVVTDDGYKAAQREVAREAAIESFDPETLIRDALFAELFEGGPQHYPPVGDPKAVLTIGLGDIRSFATRAFRSQNAYLVISGRGRPGGRHRRGERPAVERRAERRSPRGPRDAAAGGESRARSKEFRARFGRLRMGWAADRGRTRGDGARLRRGLPVSPRQRRRARASRPSAIPTRSSLGQFITLHDPGVMFVAYVGKDVDSVRAVVDDGLMLVRKPLPAPTFATARQAFEYHLLSDLQTPTQIADNFGWYAVEGKPQYAPGAGGDRGAYFAAADSLTPDFVASVVAKYLTRPAASVTLRPESKDAK